MSLPTSSEMPFFNLNSLKGADINILSLNEAELYFEISLSVIKQSHINTTCQCIDNTLTNQGNLKPWSNLSKIALQVTFPDFSLCLPRIQKSNLVGHERVCEIILELLFRMSFREGTNNFSKLQVNNLPFFLLLLCIIRREGGKHTSFFLLCVYCVGHHQAHSMSHSVAAVG